MASNRDPVRASIRTMHASFVIMFLLMFVIFGLGIFEILAAIVNPSASIVLALVDARSRPAPSSSYPVQDQPWITVSSPTQIFSVRMDPLRTAQTGERYQVTSVESGWALAVRQGDSPDRAVWIALDDHVQAPGLVAQRAPGPLATSAVVAAVLLATIGVYYGVRRRLRPRGSTRTSRRRGTVSGAGEAANGSGRVSTVS